MSLLPPSLSNNLKEYTFYCAEDMGILSPSNFTVCGVWCVDDKEITVYRSKDSLFSSIRNIRTDEIRDFEVPIQEGMTIEDTIKRLSECEATINVNGIPVFSKKKIAVSRLARSIIFDKNKWAVSVVLEPDQPDCSKKIGHTKIIIEGINDQGKVFVKIAHLKERFNLSNPNPLEFEPEISDAPSELRYTQMKGPWVKEKGKVLQMINRIELECKKRIKGDGEKGTRAENCFMWAVNRLRFADINLREKTYHNIEDLNKIFSQSGFIVCGVWWVKDYEITVYRSRDLLMYRNRNLKTEETNEGQIPIQTGMTIEEKIKYLKECDVIITADGNPEFSEKITATSLFDDSKIFDKNNWALSLFYVNHSRGGHAEIAIEGIDDQGKVFTKIAHVRGVRNPCSYIPGEPEIRDVNPKKLRSDGHKGPWIRPKGSVLRMLQRIQFECLNHVSVSFNILARGRNKKGVTSENCFVWAMNRLSLAGVHLENIKSVLPSLGLKRLKEKGDEKKDRMTSYPLPFSNLTCAPLTLKCGDLRTLSQLTERSDKKDRVASYISPLSNATNPVETPEESDPDPFEVNSKGLNVLHLAVVDNNKKQVKSLVRTYPELLETKDKKGLTPLLIAAKCDHKQICTLLLDLKADPTTKTHNGKTIQDIASDSVKDLFPGLPGKESVRVQSFPRSVLKVDQKVDQYGRNQLHRASIDGNLEDIKNLLSKNPGLLESRDKFDNTPLLLAKDRKTSKVLLKAGADKFVTNKFRNNALHMAVLNKKLNIVRLFCNEELLDVKNICGSTPLMEAAEAGEREICEYLLEAKANPHERDTAGYTPFMLAQDSLKDLFPTPSSSTSFASSKEETSDSRELEEFESSSSVATTPLEETPDDIFTEVFPNNPESSSLIIRSLSPEPEAKEQPIAIEPQLDEQPTVTSTLSTEETPESGELESESSNSPVTAPLEEIQSDVSLDASTDNSESFSPISRSPSPQPEAQEQPIAIEPLLVEQPLIPISDIKINEIDQNNPKPLHVARQRKNLCNFLREKMTFLINKIPSLFR